eukprot:482517_1
MQNETSLEKYNHYEPPTLLLEPPTSMHVIGDMIFTDGNLETVRETPKETIYKVNIGGVYSGWCTSKTEHRLLSEEELSKCKFVRWTWKDYDHGPHNKVEDYPLETTTIIAIKQLKNKQILICTKAGDPILKSIPRSWTSRL